MRFRIRMRMRCSISAKLTPWKTFPPSLWICAGWLGGWVVGRLGSWVCVRWVVRWVLGCSSWLGGIRHFFCSGCCGGRKIRSWCICKARSLAAAGGGIIEYIYVSTYLRTCLIKSAQKNWLTDPTLVIYVAKTESCAHGSHTCRKKN